VQILNRVMAHKSALSLFVASTFISAASLAASVTVNGNGSTFIINKVSGFDGAYGADREAAFVAAAQVWADIVVSNIDIVVDAQFTGLSCNSSSGTLGSAGPVFSSYYSSGAEAYGMANYTWYPIALMNALANTDNAVGNADITASFNSSIDGNNACLNNTNWYYGLDHNPPGSDIDFFEVVLHELGHGLGILSLVDSGGNKASGYDDTYSLNLKDKSLGKSWTNMSAAEILTSITDTGDLVWTGTEVNAISGDLSAGVNGGEVQMYAPSPYESGSSVSHFDTALTPNELMEPQYTGGASYDHSIALLKDIGWNIYVPANAVPVVTGQSAVATNEDTSVTITLSDLTVTDSDNTFPADFTLTVSSGANYSLSGATITPSANFSGTLTVPVIVNDGTSDSASYNFSVTVNSVNDKPVISAQATLSVNEDNDLVLSTSNLTIVDPDDSSFTLTVNSGANYSVSGTTVSPSLNYNGTLTVPVTINDGDIDSDSYNLTVTVNAVNDSPSITLTPSVNFDEDTSHTFSINDFTVSDVDSSSFTLSLQAGSNYSVSGTTITPSANYFGTLSVDVSVSDGNSSSAVETLSVAVNSLNDKPVISGQSVLAINEDNNIALGVAQLTITDPDDSTFTLTVNGGSDYTVSGSTVTPAADFEGTLTVPVTVNDGEVDSDSYNVSITVNAQNDIPVVTALPTVSFDEDTSHTLSVNDFTVVDVDSNSFTLNVQGGSYYSVSGQTITPDANYSGSLSVDITVSDGADSSIIHTLPVTVNEVNDKPVISNQSSLALDEDSNIVLNVAQLTIADPDDSSFTLTVNSGSNYTVAGSTITPTADFEGSLTVPVTVNDGEVDSDSYNLSITVNAQNDIPVITGLPTVNFDEDSSHTFDMNDFTIVDVDSSSFTLHVQGGSNYTMSGQTITPDAHYSGLLLVDITISDGTDTSIAHTLSVTVNEINDKPVITGHSSPSMAEDSSLELTPASLTIIDPDDSSHTLIVNNGTNYTVSGATITPALNFSGVITVPVQVNDGETSSDSYNLTVLVNTQNDAPVITSLPTISFDEDTTRTLNINEFVITDSDSSTFTLNVAGGTNYSVVGTSIIPDTNYFGVLNVDVSVSDGFVNSATENLVMTVISVNDAPVLSGSPALNVTILDAYSAQFSTTDTENDTLSYSVTSNHGWLSIDGAGLLTGMPTGGDIATHDVTVEVDDGSDTDSTTFSLAVADLTSADLSTAVAATTHFSLLSSVVGLDVTVTNAGPAIYADGYVLIDFELPTNVQTVASGCSLQSSTQVRCDFTGVTTTLTKTIDVLSSQVGIVNVSAQVFATQTDPSSANDWSDTTIVFESNLTTPTSSFTLLASQKSTNVTFGDMNGNGLKELLFASSNATDEIYAFNGGYSLLTSNVSLSQTTNANDVLAVDLNNDGHLDAAFANTGLNTVYFNDGTGQFSTVVQLGTADSQSVVSADLNGDSFSDLIFANLDGANRVYLNDQAGGFVLSQSLGNSDSTGAALLDYNRDGWLDVVFSNQGDDDFVYLNNGANQTSGVFNASAVFLGLAMTDSNAVVVADIDGDNIKNEIVIARETTETEKSIEVFQVSSVGVISTLLTLDVGDVTSISVADYNGDGQADIAALNRDQIILVLVQNNGQFVQELTFQSANSIAIVMGDINGDSEADIVITHDETTDSLVYLSELPPIPVQPPVEEEEEETPVTSEPETTETVVIVSSGSVDILLFMLGLFLIGLRFRAKLSPILISKD